MVGVKVRPSAPPPPRWLCLLAIRVDREGGLAGGRREYVLVGSVALARVRCPAHTARPGLGILPNPPVACLGPMALTPPAPPSRPRTVSCAPREDQKERAKAKAHSSSIRVDQGRHLPERDAVATGRGKLSKAGWVSLRGRERHGWRDRAYMGEGALLAKHCFASARTPSRQRLGRAPEGYLRRPPQTDPPSHPTDCPLLLLLLLLIRQLLVAGAGLQAMPETLPSQQASATAVRVRPSHASSRPDAASRPPATGIAA
ncbi:hypothetical protein ABH900_002849 [Stenotrophomonas sp. AN71]